MPRSVDFRNNLSTVFMIVVVALSLWLGFESNAIAVAVVDDTMPEVEIEVRKVGSSIVIDGNFLVPVSPQEAWNVLTDYEKMPQFMRSVKTSKIIFSAPESIRVAQTGGASRGILSFGFDVVREVKLKPYTEIFSRVISGTMKKSESTTRLVPQASGTRVIFHSESLPNIWVPPGIGPALIDSEMTAQFGDLKAEILRRSAVSNVR